MQFQANICKLYAKITANFVNFSKCVRNARKFAIRIFFLRKIWTKKWKKWVWTEEKKGVIGCKIGVEGGRLTDTWYRPTYGSAPLRGHGPGKVYLDQTISWKGHLTHVKNSVNRKIGLLYRTRSFLNGDILNTMYQSLILPSLEYCDVVWGNAANKYLSKLNNLQNKAGKIILNVNRRFPTKGVFDSLGYPPTYQVPPSGDTALERCMDTRSAAQKGCLFGRSGLPMALFFIIWKLV